MNSTQLLDALEELLDYDLDVEKAKDYIQQLRVKFFNQQLQKISSKEYATGLELETPQGTLIIDDYILDQVNITQRGVPTGSISSLESFEIELTIKSHNIHAKED